jgi:hypothetical protein
VGDSSYARIVVCKEPYLSLSAHHVYRHKIILAETDATASRPPVSGPFKARCDMCGKEYVYQHSDVLRIEREIPEGFVPHPLFRDDA